MAICSPGRTPRCVTPYRSQVAVTLPVASRMVELVVWLGSIERLCVIQGAAEAHATDIEHQLRARYPELTVERGEIGPVLGTHAGPGVVGVGVLLAG